MIPPVSISEISSLYLASVDAQAGLCLTWLQTSKTGVAAHIELDIIQCLASVKTCFILYSRIRCVKSKCSTA